MGIYSPDFFKNPIELDRPLDDEERESQLKQNYEQRDFDETLPHYELSVIQHNSTFVEIVDRNYPVRGLATLCGLIVMAMFGIALISVGSMTFQKWGDEYHSSRITAATLISLGCLLAICGGLYLLLKESFHYTHFPIRLNRKNRKAYIWRKTGVVTADWDKVFFFLREYRNPTLKHWDVRGNILAEDGVTVIDSFPLSSYECTERKNVEHHFEYFRRYMEVGPEQTWRMLKVCLPIAKRKETWWEGLMCHMLSMHGYVVAQILMLWFFLPVSVARWIAMQTSRIPQWPEWVEQECAVEADDPYVRESGYVAPSSEKRKAA